MKNNIDTISTLLEYKSSKLFNTRLNKKSVFIFKKALVVANILFKIKLKSYSGLRHQTKLPVRGQRTKTNAKTCKQRKKLKK